MSIRLPASAPDWNRSASVKGGEIASIIFDLEKKRVEVKKAQIQKIAKGLSEIAYSIGQTNDQMRLAEFLGEDIWEALKKVKRKQSDKKKPKKD